MSTSDSDAELMSRLRAGGREAFTVLIRRYQSHLANFFRRMGARTHECEDLIQETFLRLYRYREQYRPTGKFSSLLFVLARHAWADLMRKSSRTRRTEDAAAKDDPVPSGVQGVDVRLDAQYALEGLSDKLRMVVVLNVYQGMKYREIAEVLDLPVGTVKSRMHLALAQLRERMNVTK